MSLTTVLVADDDQNIRKLIKHYLKIEGFNVLEAGDGKEASCILESQKISIAVIDVMMPFKDGWDLCKEIRESYNIPILMVTAKSTSEDRIKGFTLGTDDYLVKPFHPVELVMRVKALLRRYRFLESQTITIGEIEIDGKSYEVRKGRERFSLPLKEFELLYTMASYPNQVFTREQLIEKIWGFDYDGDDRGAVDAHIKKLRKRFKDSTESFQIITVRGLGYRIEVRA